jgi:hypothetical protein
VWSSVTGASGANAASRRTDSQPTAEAGQKRGPKSSLDGKLEVAARKRQKEGKPDPKYVPLAGFFSKPTEQIATPQPERESATTTSKDAVEEAPSTTPPAPSAAEDAPAQSTSNLASTSAPSTVPNPPSGREANFAKGDKCPGCGTLVGKKKQRNLHLPSDKEKFTDLDKKLRAATNQPLGPAFVCEGCHRRARSDLEKLIKLEAARQQGTEQQGSVDRVTTERDRTGDLTGLPGQTPTPTYNFSTNFANPVSELQEDGRRVRQLGQVAGDAMLAGLNSTCAIDPRGAYDAAHKNKKFRAALGLDVVSQYTQMALGTFRVLIDSYKSAKCKKVKHQLLSIAAPVTNSVYASYQAVSAAFGNISFRQIGKAKIHALQWGAGLPAAVIRLPRQAKKKATALFLSAFTVDDEVVYRPAHTASQAPQFKRRLSLPKCFALFEEKRKAHNILADCDTESHVEPVSYGAFVEAMTGKGYGRMRCYTGLCETCSEKGHHNFNNLTAMHGNITGFVEKHGLQWPASLPQTKKQWEHEIKLIRDYYKTSFKGNCRFQSDCVTHDLRYALAHPNPSSDFWMDHSAHPREFSCAHCNRRLLFFENIEINMQDLQSQLLHKTTPSLVTAESELKVMWSKLEKMAGKCESYAAHLMRDANADRYQNTIKANMKEWEISADFDYMMKYKGSKFAEKKQDHFGKKSLSLLGAEFIRLLTIEEEEAEPEAKRVVSYLNVVSSDTNQDWFKAANDMYGCLKRYAKGNAHIKEKHGKMDAYVWTDGAGNFSGCGVMLMLMAAHMHTGINILECNLNEGQEGKKALDTKFAHYKGHLDTYNRAEHDAHTAEAVVAGFGWMGGVKGASAWISEPAREKQPTIGKAGGLLAGRSVCLSTEFKTDATTNERYVLIRENAGVGKGRKVTQSQVEKQLGADRSEALKKLLESGETEKELPEQQHSHEEMPSKIDVQKKPKAPRKTVAKSGGRELAPPIAQTKAAIPSVAGLHRCTMPNCLKTFMTQGRLEKHLSKCDGGAPDVVRPVSGVAADEQVRRHTDVLDTEPDLPSATLGT